MNEKAFPEAWIHFSFGQALDRIAAKRLAVAVSGGGDSMACLALARAVCAEKGCELYAVTLDHGLRPEAADEAALVAAFCEKHSIPHKVLNWSWDGSGNLQAAARKARYRLIGTWAKRNKIKHVALGHTEDDVAETFLMRLARKSGVDGLATMESQFEREGVTWHRPLLSLTRPDLRAYLRRHDIGWVEDASNEDLRFDRVKARKALKELTPLGIDTSALSAVAHNMYLAKATLDHYVWDTEMRYVTEAEGDLLLPTEYVEDDRIIPHEILYRLRCAALNWIGGGAYKPRSDGMIEMEVSLQSGTAHTLGGCYISRKDGKKRTERCWRVTREYNAVKDVHCSTKDLWDGRWALDGPHAPDLRICALGEAVSQCPDWRDTGIPRQSLLASPSVWHENTLISAPLAGFSNGWAAKATGRGNFNDFLLSR